MAKRMILAGCSSLSVPLEQGVPNSHCNG